MQLRQIAENWLAGFDKYLEEKNYSAIVGMMLDDGYWRDLLTFRWRFENFHGAREIEAWLRQVAEATPAYNFRIENDPSLGAIGEHSETLEFFFQFETAFANGRGFVRLVKDHVLCDHQKAFTLLKSMLVVRLLD
jgi:putative flavoprotein involved in K+ transport